jgi:hypothetical protein
MNQMDSSLIVETHSNSNGFTYHPVSWRTGGIYCAAFLYFTSFSFLFVPVTLLINDLITGEATNPNSESVTYSGLAYGFAALFKVLTVKYLGSFSDYIGRKPVGILLMVLHIVYALICDAATEAWVIVLASALSGVSNSFITISLAWVCDVVADKDRGVAFSLLFGAAVGGGFALGVPLGSVAATANTRLPFLISALIAAVGAVWTAIVPVDDCLGVKGVAARKSTKREVTSVSVCSPQGTKTQSILRIHEAEAEAEAETTDALSSSTSDSGSDGSDKCNMARETGAPVPQPPSQPVRTKDAASLLPRWMVGSEGRRRVPADLALFLRENAPQRNFDLCSEGDARIMWTAFFWMQVNFQAS